MDNNHHLHLHQDIKIVFEQKDKTTDKTKQFEITLDEDGGDDYYPSGYFDADEFYKYAYPLEEKNYPNSNSN